MFRHKPRITTPAATPLEPVDGFFFATPQKHLHFGSNRAIPVAFRPTLSVKHRDNFAVVLPTTSRANNNWDFFSLANEEIRWLRPDARATFLYYRYETVSLADLGNKIGVVSQNARMNIARWLNRIGRKEIA